MALTVVVYFTSDGLHRKITLNVVNQLRDPSPVSPGAEVVWPKGSEWKPGDNSGFPEPVTPAVSDGLPTSKAPQFVTGGKDNLPEVSDGEVEVRVGPQTDRPESVGVEHGAPLSVSPVSVESKSSLVEKGFRSPESILVSVIGSKLADVTGVGIFGFSLTDTSREVPKEAVGPTVVQVVMDYSEFRYAYGGDWAQRLQLWKYPAYVLTSPEKFECSQRETVEIVNDSASGTIVADVEGLRCCSN